MIFCTCDEFSAEKISVSCFSTSFPPSIFGQLFSASCFSTSLHRFQQIIRAANNTQSYWTVASTWKQTNKNMRAYVLQFIHHWNWSLKSSLKLLDCKKVQDRYRVSPIMRHDIFHAIRHAWNNYVVYVSQTGTSYIREGVLHPTIEESYSKVSILIISNSIFEYGNLFFWNGEQINQKLGY